MDLKGLGNISMHVTVLQVTVATVTMQFPIVLIVLVAQISMNAMTQAAVTQAIPNVSIMMVRSNATANLDMNPMATIHVVTSTNASMTPTSQPVTVTCVLQV